MALGNPYPIKFVQKKGNGGTGSSRALAFDADVQAGSLIVAIVSKHSTATISSVSGAGVTWLHADTKTLNTNRTLSFYYGLDSNGASGAVARTVTVTFSGSVAHQVTIAEFKGIVGRNVVVSGSVGAALPGFVTAAGNNWYGPNNLFVSAVLTDNEQIVLDAYPAESSKNQDLYKHTLYNFTPPMSQFSAFEIKPNGLQAYSPTVAIHDYYPPWTDRSIPSDIGSDAFTVDTVMLDTNGFFFTVYTYTLAYGGNEGFGLWGVLGRLNSDGSMTLGNPNPIDPNIVAAGIRLVKKGESKVRVFYQLSSYYALSSGAVRHVDVQIAKVSSGAGVPGTWQPSMANGALAYGTTSNISNWAVASIPGDTTATKYVLMITRSANAFANPSRTLLAVGSVGNYEPAPSTNAVDLGLVTFEDAENPVTMLTETRGVVAYTNGAGDSVLRTFTVPAGTTRSISVDVNNTTLTGTQHPQVYRISNTRALLTYHHSPDEIQATIYGRVITDNGSASPPSAGSETVIWSGPVGADRSAGGTSLTDGQRFLLNIASFPSDFVDDNRHALVCQSIEFSGTTIIPGQYEVLAGEYAAWAPGGAYVGTNPVVPQAVCRFNNTSGFAVWSYHSGGFQPAQGRMVEFHTESENPLPPVVEEEPLGTGVSIMVSFDGVQTAFSNISAQPSVGFNTKYSLPLNPPPKSNAQWDMIAYPVQGAARTPLHQLFGWKNIKELTATHSIAEIQERTDTEAAPVPTPYPYWSSLTTINGVATAWPLARCLVRSALGEDEDHHVDAVTGYNAAGQEVFWYRRNSGSVVENWTDTGFKVFPKTSPALCAVGTDAFDAFAIGTDGKVWRRQWRNGLWSSVWVSLGGHFTGLTSKGVASGNHIRAVSTSNGSNHNRVDLFVAGEKAASGKTLAYTIWHKWYDDTGTMSNWEELGGGLTYAVAGSAGRYDIFANLTTATSNNPLWHYSSTTASWELVKLDGSTAFDWRIVGAAAITLDRIDILVHRIDTSRKSTAYFDYRLLSYYPNSPNTLRYPDPTLLQNG